MWVLGAFLLGGFIGFKNGMEFADKVEGAAPVAYGVAGAALGAGAVYIGMRAVRAL